MAKKKSIPQRIVYAGLLMPLKHFTPADKNRVLRANGEGKKSPKQVIYVGETGLPTEERYLQHLLKYKSQRGWIHKYGIRPMRSSAARGSTWSLREGRGRGGRVADASLPQDN